MITTPFISDKLQELPASISKKGCEAEEARLEWKKLELEFDMIRAKEFFKLKLKNPSFKITELELECDENKEVYEARLKVILAEANYRKKEVERKGFDDEFTGLKVIARIHMAELSSIEYKD